MMAVSGADTTTIFDSSSSFPKRDACYASLPNVPVCSPDGNVTGTISTNNANDFVFFAFISDGGSGGSLSCSTGFSLNNQLTVNSNRAGECSEVTTATLTNRLVWGQYSINSNNLLTTDAIMQATTTVSQPVVCNMVNSAPTVSVTIKAGSTVVGTSACDGTTTAMSINPSTILSATEPATGDVGSYIRTRFLVSGIASTTTPFTTCVSGTCPVWTITNYAQILITNSQGLSVTATQFGSVASSSTGDVLTDYGSNIIVAATYTNTWTSITSPSWVYDIPQIGIQIFSSGYVNQNNGTSRVGVISNIFYNNAPIFIKFTSSDSVNTAGTRVRGFIPPITSLNLQNVYNNGIINPSATFSSNTIDETGLSPHEWDLVGVGTASPNSSPNQPPGTSSPSSGGTTGGGGITTLPIFQIQVTTTTATILGQPFVLVAPVYGDPGLIPLGIAVLVTSVAIIFLGAAFFSDRERKKREYDPQRYF